MNQVEPFIFRTEFRMVRLTGLRATNLEELVRIMGDVPGSSIFYHTHHLYLSHHFETPTFTNDFSLWVSEALQEDSLAEKLAAVDLLSFTTIRGLRDALVGIIDKELKGNKRRLRECPPGDEFHFCRSKSFILPTGLIAKDCGEFFDLLPQVSNLSLFFHFFEARLRLERPSNDFSQWLRACGREQLAKAIDAIDPYSMSLDEFKLRIMELGKTKG